MTKLTNFENGFSLFRDAEVKVVPVSSKKGMQAQAIITDGNEVREHLFSHKSQVSQALALGPEKVAERLAGGNYFFHGDDLVSYRNSDYNGFIHDDDSIRELIDHIGYTTNFSRAQHHMNTSNDIRLQSVHSKVELQIDQYQSGGEMNSELSFAWDPFQSHIRAVFQLVRLVCSNGMTGLADFMNAKIPVVNNWLEHMEIANAQIQNKLTGMIDHRMQAMARERASVRDCQRVTNAARTRLNDVNIAHTPDAVDRLRKICLVTDPSLHLTDHYGTRVIDDQRLAEQAASHLTEFTLWNMLTEMSTHTSASGGSSERAVQMHANELLIDRGTTRYKTVANGASNTQQGVEVKFDDLDAAFAGDLVDQS